MDVSALQSAFSLERALALVVKVLVVNIYIVKFTLYMLKLLELVITSHDIYLCFKSTLSLL